MAFAVFGAFWGGWAVLLPEIKDAVDASDSVFGLALLGVGVGAVPAMLMMGPIYDRYGQRTVPPLLVLFAMTTMIPGFVDSVPLLFGSLIFLGAMSGMLDIAVNAASTDWEATTERRLMNLAHAVFSGFFLVASVSVGLARRAEVGHLLILICLAGVVMVSGTFQSRSARSRTVRRGSGCSSASNPGSCFSVGCAGSVSSSKEDLRRGARFISSAPSVRGRRSVASARVCSPPPW